MAHFNMKLTSWTNFFWKKFENQYPGGYATAEIDAAMASALISAVMIFVGKPLI